jgi:tetratricopeptide (TPR) repeat protein
MIKKTSLFAAALLVSVAVFGQKAKRTSANSFREYGELDNAKESIDPCITNETTMYEAKTWFFRGQIYQAIYETKEEKFKTLDPNPLQVAFESFLKCEELDDKKFHTEMTLKYLDVQGKQFVNEGITRYNAKDYAGALTAFENTLIACAIPEIKRTDSLAIYYAGACAEQIGDLAKAEKYYRDAMAANYKAEAAIVRMQNMYATAGNDEKSLALLKEGRKLYPNNQALITNEVNVYLKADQHAEAMKSLELAIQGEPNNASLHFALGFVNDRLAAKEIEANPKGNDAYTGYLAAAEKSYSKSVELDASNFDAVYNLGALYFNQAVKMNETANLIDDTKKYEVAKAAADVVFDKALPILEKAYAINADDRGVLVSLKQLYYRKMVEDASYKSKYDEIMARMK